MIEPLETRIVLSTTPAAALLALNAKLLDFAGDKTTPPAVPIGPSTVTAKADDLVYAVYQLTHPTPANTDFDEADEIAVLVKTALTAQPDSKNTLKARADKDKIAPRILTAALGGSAFLNDATAMGATAVGDITTALAKINDGNTKTALTAAGKEAVIGQALKLTAGSGPLVGQKIADVAKDLSSAVSGSGSVETKLRTFAIAAIKAAGNAVGEVRSFTKQTLTYVDTAPAGNQEAFVTNLAIGVAKVPTAAGAVFGGYADVLNDAAGIENVTSTALLNSKLSKAGAAIVAGTASATAVTDQGEFAKEVVTDLLAVNKATMAARAAVASGAIQAINSTTGSVAAVGPVITKVLSPGPKVPTQAEVPTFAGGAAVGTGDLAAEVVNQMALYVVGSNQASERTTLTNMAVAVLKAIAPTSGAVDAKAVGAQLVNSHTAIQFDTASLTLLAQNVAKGIGTLGKITGGAVAGIGTELDGGALIPSALATFAAKVIPSASKSALNIAQEVAGVLPSPMSADYAGFASSIVKVAGFSSTNLGPVAAGVALTSLQAAGGHPAPGSGQTAGDIVLAVANAEIAPSVKPFQPKLLTIAGSVALAVDVESIAGMAGKVTAALRPATAVGNGLPKLTTIGTLATSLAKAINTKPLVGTANRIDELGELAAEMTRAAIGVLLLGPGATTSQLASTIGSIGTGVMKGLSAALLINGGPFAADLKDSARDIAGAIAQTISSMGLDNATLDAKVDTLIADGSPLATALNKAAKKFGPEVNRPTAPLGAFHEVLNAKTAGGNRLVAGTEAVGFGEATPDPTSPTTGKYEIGSVIDIQALILTPP